MEFISTQSQLNILSGGLTECLDEPRHVGVSTAGSLHTITLLPIPQRIVKKESYVIVETCIITSLTVVVTTNIGRNLSSTIQQARTAT